MKTDARKLSPQEQREKRSTALRMREQGYTYKAIGEAVGVHPRTIAHWAQVAEHKGEKAAIAGGQRGVRQGDRRSLSPSQEVLVRTLMTDKMPDQLKLGQRKGDSEKGTDLFSGLFVRGASDRFMHLR